MAKKRKKRVTMADGFESDRTEAYFSGKLELKTPRRIAGKKTSKACRSVRGTEQEKQSETLQGHGLDIPKADTRKTRER